MNRDDSDDRPLVPRRRLMGGLLTGAAVAALGGSALADPSSAKSPGALAEKLNPGTARCKVRYEEPTGANRTEPRL